MIDVAKMSVVGPILAATEGDAIDGNRRLVQFHKSIMRIVIMDKLAKLSLFERVYNWIGSDSTDGVDALIKTFYQFAGSIENHPNSLQSVRFGNQEPGKAGGGVTMEMLVLDDRNVLAILFVNISKWPDSHEKNEMKNIALGFLKRLLSSFNSMFTDILYGSGNENFRKEVKRIANDASHNRPSAAKDQRSMMDENFKSFLGGTENSPKDLKALEHLIFGTSGGESSEERKGSEAVVKAEDVALET